MLTSLIKYAPVQVVGALSVFILIAVQTRFLTPDVYGLLAVIMVLVELVRALSTQWLNSSMLRLFPSADQNEKIKIQTTILLLTILGCFFGALILLVLFYYFGHLAYKTYLLACCLFVSKCFFQFQLELSRLENKSVVYKIALLLQTVSSIVFSYYILSLHPTIDSALLGLAASYLMSIVVFGMPMRPKLDKNISKVIAQYGLPLMLSGAVSVLSSRLDRLFIPALVGLSAAGIYAANANLLLGVMSLVFMIVALPLYPDLAKLSKDSQQLLVKHKDYLDLLLIVTLPSLAGLIMLNNEIVTVFLGENYLAEDQEVFVLLAMAIFITNLKGHFIDHGLQFTMKTNIILAVSIVGMLINLISLPVLLKLYGIKGAALSLLVTNAITIFFSAFFAIKSGFKYGIGINVLKCVIATFLMILSIVAFNSLYLHGLSNIIKLAMLITSSIFVYSVALLLLYFPIIKVRLIK